MTVCKKCGGNKGSCYCGTIRAGSMVSLKNPLVYEDEYLLRPGWVEYLTTKPFKVLATEKYHIQLEGNFNNIERTNHPGTASWWFRKENFYKV